MPEWLMWALIAAAVLAGILLLGKGQITTSTQRRNRHYSDHYDPVYLQQQEVMAAQPPFPPKE